MAYDSNREFERPNGFERVLNRAFGWLVGRGLGGRDSYLLEVRGRRSGRIYSTPVSLASIGQRSFLVCPRGRSQWVRNAEAAGFVWLKRGASRTRFAVRRLDDAEKPEVLKNYLDRYKLAVKRYFPVPAQSPADAFAPIASRYTVFELSEAETDSTAAG